MSPDEEAAGGIAVADPEPTQEQEPAERTDAELPAPDEPVEGGTPEGEDEGEANPLQELLAGLEELEKTDPEAAKALRERYQPAQEWTDEDWVAWSQQNQQQRMAYLQQEAQQYQQRYSPNVVLARSKALTQQWAQEAREAAARFKETGEGDPNSILANEDQRATQIASLQWGAADQAARLATETMRGSVLEAIEMHPAARYVSQENWEAIIGAYNSMAPQDWIKGVIDLVLNDAIQNAPTVKTKELEEKAKAVEQREAVYRKALEKLPRNGTKPSSVRGGPGAGSKRYSDMTQEERDRLTPEQRDQIISRDFSRRK